MNSIDIDISDTALAVQIASSELSERASTWLAYSILYDRVVAMQDDPSIDADAGSLLSVLGREEEGVLASRMKIMVTEQVRAAEQALSRARGNLYQALRALSPEQLVELQQACDDRRESWIALWGEHQCREVLRHVQAGM